jgi:hypothetical protein
MPNPFVQEDVGLDPCPTDVFPVILEVHTGAGTKLEHLTLQSTQQLWLETLVVRWLPLARVHPGGEPPVEASATAHRTGSRTPPSPSLDAGSTMV